VRFYLFSSDLTLDTSIYADGDVLADLLTVTGATRRAGLYSKLVSVEVRDSDDQGVGLELLFFDSSITLASKNAAWATSDADMEKCLGRVYVQASDYTDLGSNRVANPEVRPFILKPASGTSIYLATRSRGTGTYTANGLHVRLGFEQD
jgi:hypothetical protein